MGTQQHVGDGPNTYIFPGESEDGGKLIIHAANSTDANSMLRYIRGLRGQSTVSAGQIIANPNMDPHPQYPDPQEVYTQDMNGDPGDDGTYGTGAPPRVLATSPEWLAYLNALGYEEKQFRADIERQRSLAKASAEHQLAGLGPEYDEQRRGIAGSMEARGMQESGEKLRKLALSRQAEGHARSGVELGLAQNLSALESQLANKMMDLGARRADQELSMRAGGYV